MEEATTPSAVPAEPFDFEAHRRNSIDEYRKARPAYEEFAEKIKSILTAVIVAEGLRIHTISARAKEIESFGDKAAKPSNESLDKPKYSRPMEQITDLSGIRVITYTSSATEKIGAQIDKHFKVIEVVDHVKKAVDAQRLGYLSVHYVVMQKTVRSILPEYKKYEGLCAEIQVRTILQHTWAEIEHDIQYKTDKAIPVAIKRRFMTLAGLLEIADREFESIQQEDIRLRNKAQQSIDKGDLASVDITPSALKAYLNKRLTPDYRVADSSYEWMVWVLKSMSFSNISQVEECINGYDDDRLSRIIAGKRQGQLSRFVYMLLAGMGEKMISRYPHSDDEASSKWQQPALESLSKAGISIGNYEPRT